MGEGRGRGWGKDTADRRCMCACVCTRMRVQARAEPGATMRWLLVFFKFIPVVTHDSLLTVKITGHRQADNVNHPRVNSEGEIQKAKFYGTILSASSAI